MHKSDIGGVRLGVQGDDAVREACKAISDAAQAAGVKGLDGYLVTEMWRADAELILGIQNDPEFGPLVMVGAGGVLVELLEDVAVMPAPIDAASARRAVQALKISPLLGAYRGRGALDLEAVVDTIVRLSWLAHDLEGATERGGGQDFEIEINPLKVRLAGQGVVAVDARARLGKA